VEEESLLRCRSSSSYRSRDESLPPPHVQGEWPDWRFEGVLHDFDLARQELLKYRTCPEFATVDSLLRSARLKREDESEELPSRQNAIATPLHAIATPLHAIATSLHAIATSLHAIATPLHAIATSLANIVAHLAIATPLASFGCLLRSVVALSRRKRSSLCVCHVQWRS